MFDRKTVFILGAGASWHYNYPTGEELVKEIVKKTNFIISCFERDSKRGWSNVSSVLDSVYEVAKGEKSKGNIDIINFLKNFVGRIERVDPPVIDYFLEWNEDLQEIGKLIIAWVILDREEEYHRHQKYNNVNRQRLADKAPFVKDSGKQVNYQYFKDNWYKFLLYKIITECKDSSRLQKNNVDFITFNYDVSLETFLYQGLRDIQFLKKNDEDVNDFLQDRFTHMYGKVRENPFVEDIPIIESMPSHVEVKSLDNILPIAYKASKNIRTIGDQKDDEDAIKRSEELLNHAEDIYILGYGFDRKNSERLGVEEFLSVHGLDEIVRNTKQAVKKNIYFTNFQDYNSVNKRASQIFTGNMREFLSGKDAILPKNSYSGSAARKVFYEKSVKNVYDALAEDFDFL